jgi:hypothetical protein
MAAWKLFQSPWKRIEFAEPEGHAELREESEFPFACFPCASFHLTCPSLYVNQTAYLGSCVHWTGVVGILWTSPAVSCQDEVKRRGAFSCLAPEGASTCVLHG